MILRLQPSISSKLWDEDSLQLTSALASISNKNERHLAGKHQAQIEIIQDATVIIDQEGLIADVGPAASMQERYKDVKFETDLDCTGMSIVPGFVDGHTHPIWAGDRVHEFAMKLAGATYMDVHKMGGGIGFSVRHTRAASEDELLKSLVARLNQMSRHGTTTAEVKTGYGLDLETEMKLLRVLHRAKKHVPIDLVINYLGGHSVPTGSDAATQTADICQHQIPMLAELQKRGEISAELIDVFCEKGVFEIEHTRQILQAGKDVGLEINFHGDELHPMKAAQLGGELQALAISHLEEVDDEGMKAMSVRPTFATLLPTTAYILRLKPPPARKLIENNVPVALGSDFNPNAHCVSMPFVMNLACVQLRMTMPEALAAATINAAGSVNKSHLCGSIEKGKWGDLVVIRASNWEHLIYQLVDPPVAHVIKKGRVIFSAPTYH